MNRFLIESDKRVASAGDLAHLLGASQTIRTSCCALLALLLGASCGRTKAPREEPSLGRVTAAGCMPETDGEFCARLEVYCGLATGLDNCGHFRVVPNCTESDDHFCTRLGRNCGTVSGQDLCDQPRTVQSCGTCSPPTPFCGPDNRCTGECAESDADFCRRLSRACGPASGTDICGVPRTVPSCGTCAPSSDPCVLNRCNAGGQCELGTPDCPPGTSFVCGVVPYCSRPGTPSDSNLPCGP